MGVPYFKLVNQLHCKHKRILIWLPHFASKPGDVVNRRLLLCFLLGLILLEGSRASCQTEGDPSTTQAMAAVPSVIPPCRPEVKEYTDQIMTREKQLESLIRLSLLYAEITIQKLKGAGQNPYSPDAVNFYRDVVTLRKKAKLRKIFEKINWRSLWWRFNLGGFVEMGFLDPYNFDKSNYRLEYRGEVTLLGHPCWVYRVTPTDHSKGWHFDGTIWVLPEALTIIRFQGKHYPTRRIHWPFLVEDFWFSFDSWRKEISPGIWMPDFTCTGVDVAKKDSFEPAFRARILYSSEDEGKPSASSENACRMELGNFRAKEIGQDRSSVASPK